MGRSGASIGAPGAMLNATCRLVVRQRSIAMDPWILDPQTAGETHKFLESTPLSFLRAGPPKFRRISAESRAHPNFDKKIAKLGHGPSRRCLGRPGARSRSRPPEVRKVERLAPALSARSARCREGISRYAENSPTSSTSTSASGAGRVLPRSAARGSTAAGQGRKEQSWSRRRATVV